MDRAKKKFNQGKIFCGVRAPMVLVSVLTMYEYCKTALLGAAGLCASPLTVVRRLIRPCP